MVDDITGLARCVLMALMLFQGARVPARLGEVGELLVLEEQDRTRWDRDVANAPADLRRVEGFLLDIVDRRITDPDSISRAAMSSFVTQKRAGSRRRWRPAQSGSSFWPAARSWTRRTQAPPNKCALWSITRARRPPGSPRWRHWALPT